MRYKVPQDVQREDQILWFITLRQLILILVGCGFSYFLFITLEKAYHLSQIERIIIWIPGALAVAFAFVRIKGLSLFKFLLLLIETGMIRAPRRYWQAGSDILVSMTQPFRIKEKQKNTAIKVKDVSHDRMKNLAAMIDLSKAHPEKL